MGRALDLVTFSAISVNPTRGIRPLPCPPPSRPPEVHLHTVCTIDVQIRVSKKSLIRIIRIDTYPYRIDTVSGQLSYFIAAAAAAAAAASASGSRRNDETPRNESE